jgi:hypothetical protein
VRGQPRLRLLNRKREELDVGQAAAGPPGGGMQPPEWFVGGDQQQRVGALTEQPVGYVQKA